LPGFSAFSAPKLELEHLDAWPAEDFNNILHAHDQLQLLFPDALPSGWKQALDRSWDEHCSPEWLELTV
jgi:hypothetical protein